MKKFSEDGWNTVGDGPFSDLGPDTMYMMSEHEIVTIRALQSTIKAQESTIGALKDTVERIQMSSQDAGRYRSTVSRYEYDILQERMDKMAECLEGQRDYWFEETRKAEAERDKLKQDLELCQSLARQIIVSLSKKS